MYLCIYIKIFEITCLMVSWCVYKFAGLHYTLSKVTRTHARIHGRTHRHTRGRTRARTRACTHAHTHARPHARMHARTRERTHVRILEMESVKCELGFKVQRLRFPLWLQAWVLGLCLQSYYQILELGGE
jgi:hypothetical protein